LRRQHGGRATTTAAVVFLRGPRPRPLTTHSPGSPTTPVFPALPAHWSAFQPRRTSPYVNGKLFIILNCEKFCLKSKLMSQINFSGQVPKTHIESHHRHLRDSTSGRRF